MIGSVDLSPAHRAIVERILKEHVQRCEVRAFGSRVAWTAKDFSDLDLTVVDEGPLPWQVLSRLKEAFEESPLPMRVDVLDWHAISESFRKVIERDYVVVQKRLKSAGRDGGRQVALGDIADIVMGQSPPGDTVSQTHGTALLNGPTEFGAHHPVPAQYTTSARKLAQPGDLLFCVRGSTTGRMNWADQEYAIGRGVAAIRHRHNPVFQPLVRGVIEVELAELLTQATGSTFPNLSARQLADIPYPSLSETEQRAISHVLGTLDDKIELNRRMNQTLEEMARALFKSWFVDFDPVRAKAALKQDALGNHAGPDTELSRNGAAPAGEWTVERARAYLAGMDPQIADLFPDRLVDSELGGIPEGWEVITLGELTRKPQYGYTQSAKDDPIGPNFLRITDINKKAWVEWESVPHCEIIEADFKKYRLYKGDILITRMADPGHGCMIEEEREAVFASYLIRFRPIQERYARFLQYWLRSDSYWELVRGRGAGTTRISLNAKVLSGFPLAVATDPILEQFSDKLSNLRSRGVANTTESHVLAAQRDALLPKLVAGNIRLRDAAKQAEAVA